MKKAVKNPLANDWQRRWLGMDATGPDIQRMADEVQRFAFRFYKNEQGPKLLVLVGDTGRGKTHCAKRLSAWAGHVAISAWEAGKWRRPPTIAFHEWSTIAAKDQQEWFDWIQVNSEEDLLIIDDIGTETDRFKSREPVERLRLLLSRRESKWTVITTNISPDEWRNTWDARVEDRLLRGSIVVNLEGVKSYAVWSAMNGVRR